jgi:heterotetrameric sarcosine oxidase delta subunit
MLLIPCPWCGARDQTEFTYHGDATVQRPTADAPAEAWTAYVYERPNLRGLHDEWWQHTSGCRQWIVVRRDTATHRIEAAFTARDRSEP